MISHQSTAGYASVVLALLVLIGVGCSPDSAPPTKAQTAGNIDLGQVAQYFQEYEELCNEDGARLWNTSLCGPLIIVDPTTRDVVANRPDGQGKLREQAGVYIGKLPSDKAIANTATEWEGVRWTMVLWFSLPERKTSRLRLLAHEAYHRVQPELGLAPTGGEMNRHLDSVEGRVWLQLEWAALRRALSMEATARAEPVADALVFRAMRRETFPGAAARETALEINEGLAEYTGFRLAGYSDAETIEGTENKQEGLESLVRSFAYISGPLYGFLLDEAEPGWRNTVALETDLGQLLATAMEINLPTDTATQASIRSQAYGGEALRTSEEERERKLQEEIAAWRRKLIDGPVLILDLNAVSSGSFNPNAVMPISDTQTVYATRELIATWGVATVDGGGVLEDSEKERAFLAFPDGKPEGTRIEGDGWVLVLNDGWQAVPGPRAGDFIVQAESP